MDAKQMLSVVRAMVPEVDGVAIRDVNDPSTWRFDGDLTTAQRVAANLALHAYVRPPAASVAQFWPTPMTPVESDVQRILEHLDLRGDDL